MHITAIEVEYGTTRVSVGSGPIVELPTTSWRVLRGYLSDTLTVSDHTEQGPEFTEKMRKLFEPVD